MSTGDEYSTGYFTDSSANCDVEGCSKWADLNEHLGGGLCVERGCQNGAYFVGERSFMQYLDSPFGKWLTDCIINILYIIERNSNISLVPFLQERSTHGIHVAHFWH